MAERERETGRKGGAAEGYAGHYYEPTVTAVTDLMIPATRVQWGPVFAGLIVALAVTFLFTGLGVAVGIGLPGILYWLVGFGSLGLFLGSMLAARTARASYLPASVHSVIVWALLMILDVLAFGNLGAALVANVTGTPGRMPVAAATSGLGWWFFIGFIIMLAASILGGIVGAILPEHVEEEHA